MGFTTFLILLTILFGLLGDSDSLCLNDPHRPQFHFSPIANWNNDPNGMVYYKGEYHLFFQYHPYSTNWGPMHWGHAVSTDLSHWEQLEIALYPDDLGTIFSGSAVVDFRNTSGLQENPDEDVLVAIFTHHGGSQQQSIAYSNDRGRTFEKYEENPVISNPGGVPDFRDPKVIEHEGKWVMALAVGHEIIFYGSEDLKSWAELSRFGSNPSQGNHGSVWECPELMKMEYDGATVWVLLVSFGGGGPNFGSATQYFIGDFDGVTFRNYYPPETVLYMEWGPDNYAGVTFSNEHENRKVLIGWMTNLAYSNDLPTEVWRGQMTIPRVLQLKHIEGKIRLVSNPPEEFARLRNPEQLHRPPGLSIIANGAVIILTSGASFQTSLMEVDISLDFDGTPAFGICFYNGLGQQICFGYEHANRQFFLDRTQSGNVGWNPNFPRRAVAPREKVSKMIDIKIFLDWSSMEIFADGGHTAMTSLFYPDEPFTMVHLHHYQSDSESFLKVNQVSIQGLDSIYDCP